MPDLPSASGSEQIPSSVAYRITRAMFVVLFFWVFWKFGGYIVTALVVRRFGSGTVSDAYFFATQAVVYGLVFAPALSVLLPAFMPIFIEEKNKRGEAAAWRFAGTVLMLVLLGCGLMLLGAYAYAGPITETLVRGFGPEARALGVRLLYWLLPGAALMVVFLLLRAVLNCLKIFSYPSAAEAFQKLLWVAVFVAGVGLLGIEAVVLGFLVGSAAMVGVAAFGLRGRLGRLRPAVSAMSRSRFARESLVGLAFVLATAAALYAVANYLPAGLARYRDLVLMSVVLAAVVAYALQLWLRSRGRQGTMARFAVLAVPLLISTFFAAYRNVVTFYFQSFTARGVFSDIEGARKIANFPIELVALALSVAMLPYLCELASKKDHALLGDIVTKALRMLAVGFVPLTVMTLILAEPICRLVLDRGDRSLVHLQYTARAVQFFGFALMVYAAERVIMQAYFSLQRMWTPALLGIAATFVQIAFLAVPIYAVGMDYPVQVFVLVALAYPVSRIFKNLLLLLILKRHVPVLPVNATALFAAKLAVLSAAVGVAAFFVLRWTERALPYEQFRQLKVAVDTFDTQPHTWSSVNAESVRIEVGPRDGDHGAAVAMTYKRHGRIRPELVRRLDGVRTENARQLSFAAYSEGPMAGLSVRVTYRDGREAADVVHRIGAVPAGQWRRSSVPLDGRGIASIAWFDDGAPQAKDNALFVDDVVIADAQDRHLFTEDFDRNGWRRGVGQTRRVKAPSGATRDETWAFHLAGIGERRLLHYDLAGTDRMRCRLLNPSEEQVQVQLVLIREGASAWQTITVQPREWQTVEIRRGELGWDEEAWRGMVEVKVRTQAGGEGIYLDDLTFRRPPRVLNYLLIMFVHCALPSVVALALMLAFLKLLRFEELGYVVQWVKARGWRRDRTEGGETPDA